LSQEPRDAFQRAEQRGARRDRATGESYCIAHHLYEVDGQRTLMKAYTCYLDQFARQSDGSWLFAERKLMVDWTETRPSNP
jgi:hypothetical protein